MLAILITLDCVRADVLEENSGLTPRLDALAPEWTTFTQAFAQSQNTLSSHLSMLSSNYLYQHGVYSNFSRKDLPPHALTRRLADRGWNCRAFTSVDFLALQLGNQVGLPDPRFPPSENRSIAARLARRYWGHRSPASVTLDRGLKWLKSAKRTKDAFLWMHLFDAHMAYEAPAVFLRQHVRAGRLVETTLREQLAEKGWFSPDFPEYDWTVPLELFPERYRAAVAYQDDRLGAFVDGLKAAGHWEDALVMVTADHGECLLGDHAVYCAHKKLFDTTVRVPLRVKFPRGLHAGERVDALVQHVDLAPTVASLAGFEEPLYAGRDLRAVASGSDLGHDTAFSEHVDNFLRAIRDRDWIYVERVPGAQNKWDLAMEEGSLFRRDGTPAPEAEPAHVPRLRSAMEAVLSSGAEARSLWGGEQAADEETSKRLQELGYM
jgi:arylsulfatase A-like enzyme